MWYNNINCSKNNITKSEPVIEISSDASSFGWGAVYSNIRTGRAFKLLAAKFSLKIFVKVPDAHVKLLPDNTTTIHDINNMHSNKHDLCHYIISEITAWAEDKSIWITVSYIPAKENYDVDAQLRKKTNRTGMDA